MSVTGLHVVHIITGLDTGGAERQLIRLLAAWKQAGMQCSVICLRTEGSLSEQVRSLDIPLYHLNMRFGIGDVMAPLSLRRLLRRLQPNVIQTWMYHADILGGMAAWSLGIPCIWNIRQLNLDPTIHSRVTMAMIRLGIRWSHSVPAHILSNSERAKDVHIEAGYAAHSFTVIPNGVDTDRFRPNKETRSVVRQQLHISQKATVIGHVARFDPQKDHETLFKAIQQFFAQGHEAVFVIVGRNVTPDTPQIHDWLDKYGLTDRVRPLEKISTDIHSGILMLDERSDVDQIYTAMDLCTLTSISEASPNVLGEAMSCGVPCVSTDVGEAARILGETGAIVPPKDAFGLAEQWYNNLHVHPAAHAQHQEAARHRILTEYKTEVVAAQYVALYQRISDTKES